MLFPIKVEDLETLEICRQLTFPHQNLGKENFVAFSTPREFGSDLLPTP